MHKKILMKIRLRQDGTWEHVYQEGLTALEVANKQREQYLNQAQDYIERAVEISGYKDAIKAIDYIRKLK